MDHEQTAHIKKEAHELLFEHVDVSAVKTEVDDGDFTQEFEFVKQEVDEDVFIKQELDLAGEDPIKLEADTYSAELPTCYECGVCRRTFRQPSLLRTHLLSHVGAETKESQMHECAVCGKQFKRVCNLRTHILVHAGQLSYRCAVCSEAFSTQYHLRRHSQSHTHDELSADVVCGVCQKHFRNLVALTVHTRVHGRERVECGVCGKAFGHISILRRHATVHEKKPMHNCVVCGKAFRHYSNLKTHSITHTEFHMRTYWANSSQRQKEVLSVP